MTLAQAGFVGLVSLGIGGAVTIGAALILAHLSSPHLRYRVASSALLLIAIGTAAVAVWAEAGPAPWMAWLALLWAGGATGALIRFANSLRGVARLREASRPAGPEWQVRLDRCARRLGLTRPVALLLTDCRDVPCTVGVWSPALIFPAALLSRLSPAQWDALALHELAHVRRRDYPWHLLQSLLAAILCYQPGVRWLTRAIAREREACCDLEAASACGPLVLADALAAAERHRASASRASEAAPRALRSRVEVLLGEPAFAVPATGTDRILMASALAGAASIVILWPGAGPLTIPATPLALAATTGLGLTIGLRHAVEPDHLVAVATLVSSERGVGAALRLGASWGIGHTLALMAIGSLLIAARQAMPPAVGTILELAVATMIFGMGVRALVHAWRLNRDGDVAVHAHGAIRHAHATSGAHVHIGGLALATRPLVVGLVHGLAGSGALTALAMAAQPSWPEQMAFVLLFGLGSTVGMAAVTGLAGWPIARLVRTPGALAGLSAATGVAAVIFSAAWVVPVLARLG